MTANAPQATLPLLVDSRTAADMLAISPRTLAKLSVPGGVLPAVRIGSQRKPLLRYRICDLEKFCASHCNHLDQT